MRDLDLTTLRLLRRGLRHRNIARAAEQEHIEPSAISKRLAQLEDDARHAAAGARAARRAADAGRARAARACAHACCSRWTASSATWPPSAAACKGQVRLLATVSAIAESLLDDVAAVHARAGQPQHPGRHRGALSARARARACAKAAPRSACAGTRVDLEGLRAPPLPRATSWRWRSTPDHPLAGRKTLRFEQTLDYEHVGLPPNSAVQVMLQRAAAQAGRTVSYRVMGFDAALRVVAANLGVSVVPLEVGRRAAAGAGIELIPLDDAWAERRFAICFRDFAALPPPSRRLVGHSSCARRWPRRHRERLRGLALLLLSGAGEALARALALPFRARSSAWCCCSLPCAGRRCASPAHGRRLPARAPLAAVRAGWRRRHHPLDVVAQHGMGCSRWSSSRPGSAWR